MILAKTEIGHRVMKDRSIPLTPRQRSTLILFDGKRTLAQVLEATASTGVTQTDIDKLSELGLVRDSSPRATAAKAAAVAAAAEVVKHHKERTRQERYADAYPIATRLTAELGLRGFRLNLAVEAAADYEGLVKVASRIQEAVGPQKYSELDDALNDR
jgi:hypothetical protein